MEYVYYYEDYYKNAGYITDQQSDTAHGDYNSYATIDRQSIDLRARVSPTKPDLHNEPANTSANHLNTFHKRAPQTYRTKYWELSQMSLPPKYCWKSKESKSYERSGLGLSKKFNFYADDSPAGLGQTVYAVMEFVVDTAHIVRLTFFFFLLFAFLSYVFFFVKNQFFE